MLPSFFSSVLELITATSTELPPDVRAAMRTAMTAEPGGTRAAQALTIIAQNIDQAAADEGPICQDTGMPTFEVQAPVGANQIWMRQEIREAVAEATRRGMLRPNSVDSITGQNSGDNLGPGTPIIHFHQWEREVIEVKLLLKGGTRFRPSCRTWDAPTAHWRGYGSASFTRSGKRRGKGAAPGPSGCASGAIARPGTCTRKSSCSARSTT
jgi:tartrate/fumarate subfamily iron-sulfur-dependent hydro-lyase alpha chain